MENASPGAALVDELQIAFKRGGGSQPSHDVYVRRKWDRVARYVLDGARFGASAGDYELAIELHHVFIGEGHKTELYGRPDDDPSLLGWRSVARYVMALQPKA